MEKIIPRWEYRVFAEDLGAVEGNIRAHERTRVKESEEDYIVCRSSGNNVKVRDGLLDRALESSWQAARDTLFVEHEILVTLARILSIRQQPVFSDWLLDHALILAPKEPALLSLRENLNSDKRCSPPDR